MRIVVTGADGFLGRRVVDKLLAAGGLGPGNAPLSRLVLIDLHMRRSFADPRVVPVEGSFVDAETRARALSGGVDLLFHLASLPGGAAQAHYALGRAVNLEAPIALFDAVCARGAGETPPVVVNASSIAALGATGQGVVTDDTAPRPSRSYGCHKLMLEIHLADLTARGWLDARSLRPAGIVPRPRAAFEGFATAWMSELFHALAAGTPCRVPLAREGSTWLQSVDCVADNFLHAARLPSRGLPSHRAWTLPALNPRMGELVQAIAEQTSAAPVETVGFGTDASCMPEQRLPLAEALGFHHDGTLDALVRHALGALQGTTAKG